MADRERNRYPPFCCSEGLASKRRQKVVEINWKPTNDVNKRYENDSFRQFFPLYHQ